MTDLKLTGIVPLGGSAPAGSPRSTGTSPASGGNEFGKILRSEVARQAPLRYSAHALQRLSERGIRIGAEDQARIEGAVRRAETKGSRETLVLQGDHALIVNVRNRTVVTAMGLDQMKENVITNIDSTVLA